MKNSMNIWLSILTVLVVSIALAFVVIPDNDTVIYSDQKATILFNKSEIDLGVIEQDQPKKAIFSFTNSGDAPFIIYDVETSCGCTGAEWPKKPIKSGEKEEIIVTYDAKEPGRFIKSITVYGNLDTGSKRLVLKGEVQLMH